MCESDSGLRRDDGICGTRVSRALKKRARRPRSLGTLACRAGIKPPARFGVDADEAYVIAPEPADVAERGVAALLLQRDAILDIVLEAQMAVAEQIDIHHLDVRQAGADVVALGERRTDVFITALVVDRSDFVVLLL